MGCKLGLNHRQDVLSSLLLFIFFLLPIGSFSLDCSKSRRDWLNFRYQTLMGTNPVQAATSPLPVCPIPDGNTCCDSQMEADMYSLSSRQLTFSLTKWLKSVSQQMENDAVALDYYFRSNLKEARDRLHDTFSGIYGYTYKRNHAIFFSLFSDLDDYLAGKRGNLRQLMDNFFTDLRTSIVALMEGSSVPMPVGGSNAIESVTSTNPDWTRIKCLATELGKHNAFDGVDVRIRSRFLEAYPPARMLVNSLAASSRLLASIANEASVRPECIIAYARLQYCGPYCTAYEAQRSALCPSVCERFVSSCFNCVDRQPHRQLPVVWQKLIDSITATTTRLERSFNFPVVNNELHMSLSEAITFVQSKYPQVKSSLEQECKSGKSTGNQRGYPVQNTQNSPYQNNEAAGWAYSRSRKRRSAGDIVNITEVEFLSRQKRQPSSNQQFMYKDDPPASEEFLNWQRSQFPKSPSGQSSQKSSRDNLPVDRSEHLRRKQTVAASSPVSNQDRLTKWSGQLKAYYSAQKNLLNSPPDLICRKSSSSSDCWNPPPIEESKLSREFQTAVDDLSEAATQLQASASTEGDPEVLEMGAQILRDLNAKKGNYSASPSPLFSQQNMLDGLRHSDVNSAPQSQQSQQSYSSNDAYRQPNPQRYPGFSDQIENSGYEIQQVGQQGLSYAQPPQPQYPPYQPAEAQPNPVDPRGSPDQSTGRDSDVPPDWESSGMEPPPAVPSVIPDGNQPGLPQPSWQDSWRPGSSSDHNNQVPRPDQQPPENPWQPQPDLSPQKAENPAFGGDFESSGMGVDLESGPSNIPQLAEGRFEESLLSTGQNALAPKAISESPETPVDMIANTTPGIFSTTKSSQSDVEDLQSSNHSSQPRLLQAFSSTVSPSTSEISSLPASSHIVEDGELEPQRPPLTNLPDDEDFARPQGLPILPYTPQPGSENAPPSWPGYDQNLRLPSIPETSGYLPSEPEKPVPPPVGPGETPPDCSSANAGSGLDLRCLQNPDPELAPQSPNAVDLGEIDPTSVDRETSGEYAPAPIGEYSAPDGRRLEDERGTFFGTEFNQRPDDNFAREPDLGPLPERDRFYVTGSEGEVHSVLSTTTPLTEPPLIELPSDIWVPEPSHRPDKSAGSQLFLPMYSKVQGARQKFHSSSSTSSSRRNVDRRYSLLILCHAAYLLLFP